MKMEKASGIRLVNQALEDSYFLSSMLWSMLGVRAGVRVTIILVSCGGIIGRPQA